MINYNKIALITLILGIIGVQGYDNSLNPVSFNVSNNITNNITQYSNTTNNITNYQYDNITLNLKMNYSDVRSYASYFTRSRSLSAGTQQITGLPFTPSSIHFYMNDAGNIIRSFGFSTSTTNECNYIDYSGSNGQRTDYSICSYGNGVNYLGTVSSYDTNGFTINWIKSGSQAGTISIIYMAYR